MYLKLDIDSIANALWTSWKSAHSAEDHEDWLHRWGVVEAKIEGMWLLVTYADSMDDKDEIRGYLDMIKEVAFENKYSWEAREAA